MKNQVTFGHLLALLIGIIIPIIIWGSNVERRFEQVIHNTEDIEVLKNDLKETSKTNQENFDKVFEYLHNIELELKDKKDRE